MMNNKDYNRIKVALVEQKKDCQMVVGCLRQGSCNNQ